MEWKAWEVISIPTMPSNMMLAVSQNTVVGIKNIGVSTTHTSGYRAKKKMRSGLIAFIDPSTIYDQFWKACNSKYVEGIVELKVKEEVGIGVVNHRGSANIFLQTGKEK